MPDRELEIARNGSDVRRALGRAVSTKAGASGWGNLPGPSEVPLTGPGQAPTSVIVGPYTSMGWSAGSQVTNLFQSYAPLGYFLPFQVLDYIELLATYNPDYSQAVDNIRTLANSGHILFVEGKSSLATRRLLDIFGEKARTIQERHGGVDGLIDKLLRQASVYGAMCGEYVLSEDLTDVVDFIDVNPKLIRFFWDYELVKFVPFQKVTALQAREAEARGQEVRNMSFVRLNENTFHYYAFDAAPGSPYGTPPFLAALANIAIQRDMVGNMSQIVKKIGLLGILDMTVKQLPMIPGETSDAYATRAGAYLDQYVSVMQDMVREGGIVHFDDVETNAFSVAGNAAGATNIFKQNEEQIFSGLKAMPSLAGRNYSTTETYAGVAYDIFIRNTLKYQRACQRMIESGYWLIAMVNGEDPEKIHLEFNSNKTLHRLQDAQAELLEIRNALMKWVSGFIDQMGAAQELGYSSVAKEMEDPPKSQIIGNASPGGGAGVSQTGTGIPPSRSDD